MICSFKNRFLFIKTRKTAGTSTEIVLSTICGEEDIVSPIVWRDEILRMEKYNSHCRNYHKNPELEERYLASLKANNPQRYPDAPITAHTTLQTLLSLTNIEDIRSFLLVFTVRHPYELVLSYTFWMLGSPKYQKKDNYHLTAKELRSFMNKRGIDAKKIEIFKNNEFNIFKGFQEFPHLILRYENLQEDVDGFLSKFGYCPVKLPVTKRLNRDAVSPKEFFSAEEIDEINDIFEDYFRIFKYEKFHPKQFSSP